MQPGQPAVSPFDGEIPLPHLKVTVSDHLDNPFGIEVSGALVELMQIDHQARPDL